LADFETPSSSNQTWLRGKNASSSTFCVIVNKQTKNNAKRAGALPIMVENRLLIAITVTPGRRFLLVRSPAGWMPAVTTGFGSLRSRLSWSLSVGMAAASGRSEHRFLHQFGYPNLSLLRLPDPGLCCGDPTRGFWSTVLHEGPQDPLLYA
jgi:hypothetical protein